MRVPKAVQEVINGFERLPGIGPKTAQRLAYYLLHVPQFELDNFAKALEKLKKDTELCLVCKNISETNPCSICKNHERDQGTILLVEQPLDILAFEKMGTYKGLYHVLHGAINPLENIGPEELFIEDLISRISQNRETIHEVIIATNPTMEGEATALYVSRRIKEEFPANGHTIHVTRLGMGVPTGAYLEFADETTLNRAVTGRTSI